MLTHKSDIECDADIRYIQHSESVELDILLPLRNKFNFWNVHEHIRCFRERSGSVVEYVLDSRPRGRGFKPHRCHCVVVLEQDTFILA